NSIDFAIPYVAEAPWDSISPAFDHALELLDLTGAERVLDLGAGRTWAAKQFALRGCEAVALDIVPDLNVGLGRGYAMMADAGVDYHLIVADGENSPFAPGSFDLVFCCGTLHHAQDLAGFFDNIHRVLRPGGRLCAISEPCIAIWDDEGRRLADSAAEELELGIHETLPTLPRYLAALGPERWVFEQLLPGDAWPSAGQSWPEVASARGARLGLSSPRGLLLWLARRLQGARQGIWQTPVYPQAQTDPALAQAEILSWCGGALFLIARKK
ncbi:MAG: class I SAM-dependent methyltransferase, partial [Anaerolineales bacterium]|nr:class I SAM-dependent methyltransferase [Anaerolineales bacterium]